MKTLEAAWENVWARHIFAANAEGKLDEIIDIQAEIKYWKKARWIILLILHRVIRWKDLQKFYVPT